MKIIQTHPQDCSADERKQQLLSIHSRCVAAVWGTESMQRKTRPETLRKDR